MFEAKLLQGSILKKILDAMKEFVKSANWNCSGDGISLQAIDEGHVALVSLKLNSDLFEQFRCDRNVVLGTNIDNFTKLLRCCGNEDSVTLRAEDQGDILTLIFESPNGDRVSQYELKLMDVDDEQLGIPETSYDSVVKMPSHEFQRICRDLSQITDSVSISCTKGGVTFSGSGDLGSGKVTLKQTNSIDKEADSVSIELNEPINLTFAGRYLNHFSRATSVANSCRIYLKAEHPLVLEYPLPDDMGWLKYYLAPKIDDNNEMQSQDDED
jgi:proliferating cell nuclear antigen